jgi:hypothetical protein
MPAPSGHERDTDIWEMSEALADLREFAELTEIAGGLDAFVDLGCFINSGASFLECEVDPTTAEAASDRIIRYKLAEPIFRVLSAVRAFNRQDRSIEGGSGEGGESGARSRFSGEHRKSLGCAR